MKNKKTSTTALLRIILEMYKGDPEGLLEDLEITCDRDESLKDWAQGCLEALEDEWRLSRQVQTLPLLFPQSRGIAPTTTKSMSHLVGYVLTTYEKLEEKLGQPDYIREGTYSNPLDESDGKTSTEWERGSFYVYDWKNE